MLGVSRLGISTLNKEAVMAWIFGRGAFSARGAQGSGDRRQNINVSIAGAGPQSEADDHVMHGSVGIIDFMHIVGRTFFL